MKPASDMRYEARRALQGKWMSAVGTAVAATLLGSNLFLHNPNANARYEWRFESEAFYGVATVLRSPLVLGLLTILALLSIFVGGAILLGWKRYNQLLILGETPTVGVLFSRFDIFGKAFGLRILTNIKIFLWTLLFLFPGIWAAYRYSLAPFLMAERPEIGVLDAIEESKRLMKGNCFRSFCLDISFIGWDLLSVLTLGVAQLWITPYRYAAQTVFYKTILEEDGQTMR